MRRQDILVQGQAHLEAVSALLVEGWVPDPVLMSSGRPNIIEGIGAVYHLVLRGLEGGEDVQRYMQLSRFAEPEPPGAGEFAGVVGTLSLPHGQSPEPAAEWSVYKVYEKVVIWLHRVHVTVEEAPAP